MNNEKTYRGHKMTQVNNIWVSQDTGIPISQDMVNGSCGHCNKKNTPEGHDACLGTLNGVMNACCGHEDKEQAYVQFWDGSCVRGEDAVVIMDILKKGTEPCFVEAGILEIDRIHKYIMQSLEKKLSNGRKS